MKKNTIAHISCVLRKACFFWALLMFWTIPVAMAYENDRSFETPSFAVSIQNGKYGIIDLAQGRELLPCVHDELEMLGRGFIKTSCKGYVLYYNLNGQKREQPLPYAIASIYTQSGYILVTRQNQYGLLNAQGVMVLDIQFERIEHIKEDFWRVFYAGDCHVVNIALHDKTSCEDYNLANKPQILKKRYEVRYTKTADGKLAGVYDLETQKFIVPQLYHNIQRMPYDKFLVLEASPQGRDTNYGLFDHTGKMLAEPIYDSYNFVWSDKTTDLAEHPLYRFTKDGKTGIINATTGEVISPFVYAAILDTNGIYAPITHDHEKYGLLNRITGKEVLPPIYDRINMTDPHAVDTYYIVLNGKRGLFYQGKLTLPPVYNEIRLLDNRYALVKAESGWGLYTLADGSEVFAPVYDTLYGVDMRPDYDMDNYETPMQAFALIKDGHTTFIDMLNGVELPQISINGEAYIQRNAPYVVYNDQNDKWGLYNGTNGQELAPRVYDGIEVTLSEIPTALLYLRDKNGDYTVNAINATTGQKLTPETFQEACMLNHDYMLANRDGKQGIFNVNTQKWTLPLAYDFIDEVIINGHITAAQNGKFGVVNVADSQTVIPFIYDNIMILIEPER